MPLPCFRLNNKAHLLGGGGGTLGVGGGIRRGLFPTVNILKLSNNAALGLPWERVSFPR